MTVHARLRSYLIGPWYDRSTMVGPVYQLHVLLRGVEPAIWRRLLVSGNTSLAGLHSIVQAAFAWSDARRHYFVDSAVN